MMGARGRKSKRRIGVDLFQFLILSGAIADSECLTMFILSLLSSKDKIIINQYALSSASPHIGLAELRENKIMRYINVQELKWIEKYLRSIKDERAADMYKREAEELQIEHYRD